MRERRAISALLGALAFASSAHAENVVLHVSADGVERLERLSPALPETLFVPRSVTEVSQCSSRNGTIDLQNGQAQLVWNDLQLSIEDDRLHIETVVDVDATGDVDLDNLACFVGASGCNVSIHGYNVALSTDVALLTGEDGQLSFVPYDSRIDVGGISGLEIDIDGCFLGNVAEVAIDLVDSWAQSWFDEELGELASVALSHVLVDLPLTIPERLQLSDYVMYSDFEETNIDPVGGITVSAEARIGSTFGTIPTLDQGLPGPTEPAIRGIELADFQLAASDQLASSALRQAWWDGAFTKLLSEAKPSFEISSDALSQRLGLPAGTTVELGIDVLDRPTVTFGRDEVDEVSITLPDTVVEFTIRSPNAPPGVVEVRTSAHVIAGFRIGAGGALVLEAHAMEVDRLQLSTGESLLDADPARMEQLIADVVLPLLADSLESVPLAPALIPMDDLYVWIQSLEASGGWLRASFDLFSRNPSDDTPPDTFLEDRRYVRAGLVALEVGGSDDATPDPLIRYQAWLDGEPLREEPYFLNHLRFTATDGEYLLEVAAVDLNDNIDPQPARVELVVNGIPPQLQVHESPAAFLKAGRVEASWTASDEHDGVVTRWEIFELDDDGAAGVVVAEGETGADGLVQVDGLPRDDLYVLRITAEDEAGNLTSQEFGFAFEETGCRAATGQQPSAVMALMAMLLVAIPRRRRR